MKKRCKASDMVIHKNLQVIRCKVCGFFADKPIDHDALSVGYYADDKRLEELLKPSSPKKGKK